MAPTRPAVLLLCEDPVASQVLRSLLRAVPPPPTEVHAPGSIDEALGLASRCSLCLLEPGFAGADTPALLERLRAVAPALRVSGVLGEMSRHGDRVELMRALGAGMQEVLALEDISVARLAMLLRGSATPAASLPALPAVSAPEPAVPANQAAGASLTGSWHISLAAQQAMFDAATLARLGHPRGGSGIADWKALIHPEDIDALVGAVQAVLEGAQAPTTLHYRLRGCGGTWLPVRSERIVIEHAPGGTPVAIVGHFRDESASIPAPDPVSAREVASATATTDPDIQCQTALLAFRRGATGGFELQWCNDAARVTPPVPHPGAAAESVLPACDGVQLCAALHRVADSGIAESHDALLLDRAEPPQWRRFQLGRLADGAVLVESIDISDLMNNRHLRRAGDELAQYVVRSLPLTTLVLDDSGRVLHCLATAAGPLGDDPLVIEDQNLAALLGQAAGEACLRQVVRTLNTGRPAVTLLERDGGSGQSWIECHTTLLRARPGMPPRVVLGLLDATSRTAGLLDLRSGVEQLRATLRCVPLPLYLKDAEGRYTAISPAFGQLMGIEESMLSGKTDFEVFPDELAAELHASERRVLGEGEQFAALQEAGAGTGRAPHWCLEFPVRSPDGVQIGCAGLWIPLESLPRSAFAPAPVAPENRGSDLAHATASVVSRVEDTLTDSGDYASVLRQLEQLVETTMQAQAIIHNVAGQPVPPPARPLVALAPLAQEIFDLERILVPPTARFENHIDNELPPAHCEPVAFHQILLRAIRHARRTLGAEGTLCIRLRASTGGGRGCSSCGAVLDGHYVELVIEDTDSALTDSEIDYLTGMAGEARAMGSALDDLAEIHALAHAQGGHLQIQRNVPAGTSVQVFFRAGSLAEIGDTPGNPRSIIAQFPRGRSGRG